LCFEIRERTQEKKEEAPRESESCYSGVLVRASVRNPANVTN
jgi:hypothetical protein